MGRRGDRLAGFVMSALGYFTYGTTSPFGLVLSVEKLYEPDRPPGLKLLDCAGAVAGLIGTAVLPVVLLFMWNYSFIGPWPVCGYLYLLAVWVICRKRFVWPGLGAARTEPGEN